MPLNLNKASEYDKQAFYIFHQLLLLHALIQKVLSEGSNSDKIFWEERGSKNHQKQAIIWPASKTPLKWHFTFRPIMAHIECWLGSFAIFQGMRTSIAKKPYIFLIFQRGGGGGGGGGSDLLSFPSGSAHVLWIGPDKQIVLSAKM